MAAVDYFLKIDGIEGDSTDDKHRNEIEVESFSWGLSQSGSFGAGGGASTGKVQFQDFHFTAKTSKASPKLFLKCATGEHIKEATITCRRAGESQQDFMFIKMNDVLISSYQTSGNGDVPDDASSLAFAKVNFSFAPQGQDGKLLPAVNAGWDLKANKAV